MTPGRKQKEENPDDTAAHLKIKNNAKLRF